MPLLPNLRTLCIYLDHEYFLLYFLLNILIDLFFIFRSTMHFEVIFIRYEFRSVVIVLVYEYPIITTAFIEKSILPWNCFCTFVKIQLIYLQSSVYGISIFFHWSMCLFFCQYHAIVINCCYIVLKLRISFSIATENLTWVLVGILFLTYRLIRENQHLFYGKSYSQWTWYNAPLIEYIFYSSACSTSLFFVRCVLIYFYFLESFK